MPPRKKGGRRYRGGTRDATTPWAMGLHPNAPKGNRKRPVGNRRISQLKKSQMGRIGLSAALALKTLKKHEPPITHTNFWSTTASGDRCLVVQPYALDRSTTNSETQRECNNIYYFNSRGQFEVMPLKTNVSSYYIRFIMGWSKGDPDGNANDSVTASEGAHSNKLSALLPTIESELDNDHYRVITDRVYTHSPSQIYNHSYVASGSAATFVSNANWKPFIKKYNFKFNKKVLFDGDHGSDAVGEIPFVAILMYQDQHETAYTGHTGANLSPDVKVEEKCYFKDC